MAYVVVESRTEQFTAGRDPCRTPTRSQMNIHFKITKPLLDAIFRDLIRPHPFAAERVGFVSCKPAFSPCGLLILAENYHPVAEEDYLRDWHVGAMMGPTAIRKALQLAYSHENSMFHVHLHNHDGVPSFSETDFRESNIFVPDFFNVQLKLPHGALILSKDSAVARCWPTSAEAPVWVRDITFVGSPMTLLRSLCPSTNFSGRVF